MLEKEIQILKTLDYGDDLAPLDAIDNAIAQTKDDAKGSQAIEKALLSVLTGDASSNGKDYACRKLKLVAGEASVETLSGLLSDEKMAHMARFALESMPAAAAGKALLAALPKLSGTLKAGVISSLGTRQENGAVSSLASLLSDSDPTVARAAALALGAIRSKDAASALAKAKPNPAATSEAIDSSLACAESLLAAGDKGAAMGIYSKLMKGDQPKHIRLAAQRGFLSLRGAR